MIQHPRKIAQFLVFILPFVFAPVTLNAQGTSASSDSPADNHQPASISGTVLSADTGEALKKADVILEINGDTHADRRVCVTGADGKFSFQDLPAGTYTLILVHDGYIPKDYGSDSYSLGQPSGLLVLAAGQNVTDVIVRLQKYAVVWGRVVDEDGDPVRNVTVQLVRRVTRKGKSAIREDIGQGNTNDLGEYRLFDLMPGRYYVRVNPELDQNFNHITIVSSPESKDKVGKGYVTTYYPGVTDSSRATEIELKPGDEISSIDIALLRSRTYTVRGRVIDQSGVGHYGSHLIKILSEAEPESITFQPHEDSKDGSFELGGLLPGTYMLEASVLGENSEAVSGYAPILISDADITSASVVINRPASIHGRITMEGGEMPESLTIELSSMDNIFLRDVQAEVKPNGTFEFPHLNESKYQLAVLLNCAECYLKSARMNGVDILAQGLEVSANTPGSVELVLSRRAGKADIQVTREDGQPATDATVLLVPDPPFRDRPPRYKTGTTDLHGEILIRGVAPGGYRAFAFQRIPDDADIAAPEFILPFEFKGEALTIDENGNKTLHLKLISTESQAPSK
jgi:hypothetical protein